MFGLAFLAAIAGFTAYLAIVPTNLVGGIYLALDVAAGAGDSTLKRMTPPPIVERVEYTIEHRPRSAVVVRSADNPPRAAIVLVAGAVDDGSEHPRLRALAASLARARFLALIPVASRAGGPLLSSDDAEIVADALRFLVNGRIRNALGAIGIIAVSYGVGPSVIAALEPDLRDQVGFLIGAGGYYSLFDSLRYLTTGQYRDQNSSAGAAEIRQAVLWHFFFLFSAGWADSERERAAVANITRAKLADPDADVAHHLPDLGAESRATFDLFVNRDPAKFESMLERFSPRVRDGLRAVDLYGRDLSQLKVKLILVHGRHDPVIPAQESVRLAAAAPGRSQVHLLDVPHHTDPGSLSLGAIVTVVRVVAALGDAIGVGPWLARR